MDTHLQDRAVEELLTTYNELNGDHVTELDEEPSPLEFMRYVHRNTPFVVRGGAVDWKAFKLWNTKYLKTALAGHNVNVAVTPKGNADAPTFSPEHGTLLISKPHEEDQPFSDFLEYVQNQASAPDPAAYPEVRYAQTQNDNLRNEYATLYEEVQKDIPWARVALGRSSDAINLWIGNERSVTCLHKDPMENIYVQIRGRKHFVLLPSISHPCTNEQMMRPATYTRDSKGLLRLSLDDDQSPVPLATWDPDQPEENTSPFSHLAKPLRVTLEPGDMLYLPAMWYHKVSQSCIEGEEPFVLAVNYWFDMEYSGLLYPVTNFIRNIKLEARVNHE